jgi:ubiquitin carboxyl-terminal hydrolase 25/28
MASPLHHFMHNIPLSQPCVMAKWSTNSFEWVDTQRFECSAPLCSAKLTIRFRPPRLPPAWVSLLTDPEIIKERAAKAISEDPERLEGIAAPSPVDVMMNLRHYIVNALNTHEKRIILGNNKKWMVCFGESCSELLEYLGFSRRVI